MGQGIRLVLEPHKFEPSMRKILSQSLLASVVLRLSQMYQSTISYGFSAQTLRSGISSYLCVGG